MDRIVNKGDIRVRVDVRGGANDLLAPGEGGTYGIVDNVNELSETCIIYRDGQQILAGNLDVDGEGSEEQSESGGQEADEQVEAEDSEQDDQEQVEEESDENDESDEDEQEAEQDESDEDSESSLDELDYRELQELAGDYEDVQGNLPKDELLEELKAKQ